MNGLYSRLVEYSASDYYGFHMPGHKRRAPGGVRLPYEIDITEIEGFDDLHHSNGILKEAQRLAAKVYGAEESRYLVNGSTAGILSAILGSTCKGERILVARHCHKSVYHAIYLNELKPVYLYPEFEASLHMNMDISVSAVRTALMACSDIRAVVIVSPTFEGVISDIRGIADVVHEYGIPLIVDEAHGSHLGFHPYFGMNALAGGADVVIHSVHKTLPSLTQTALLHVQGEIADRRRIFRYLDMLQSSSPSYILMASIDNCVRMLDGQVRELFEDYVERLTKLRKMLGKLKCLKLAETENYDCSKLVISVNGVGMTGKELYRILLERYHLQMEMAAGTYVVAMTSVSDSQEGFDRLQKALFEIDAELGEGRIAGADRGERNRDVGAAGLPVQEQVMTCAEAIGISDGESGAEELVWQRAEGRISAEYAYLYPPGIPLIVPGERISKETVSLLLQYQAAGFLIEGTEKAGQIRVLRIQGE